MATARLIVQLQIQDAVLLTVAKANGNRQSDADIARKISEDELKEIQGPFPSHALGEKMTDRENDREAACKAAAFGWKFDEPGNQVDNIAVPVFPRVPPPVKLVTGYSTSQKIQPGRHCQSSMRPQLLQRLS